MNDSTITALIVAALAVATVSVLIALDRATSKPKEPKKLIVLRDASRETQEFLRMMDQFVANPSGNQFVDVEEQMVAAVVAVSRTRQFLDDEDDLSPDALIDSMMRATTKAEALLGLRQI